MQPLWLTLCMHLEQPLFLFLCDFHIRRQDWVSSQLNCCHFSLSNGLRHALIRSNARLTSSRCSFDLTFPPQQLQQRVATHMKTVKSDTWRHGSDLIHSHTKKKPKTLKSGSFSQILHYETTLLEPPMALWKNETKQIGGQVDAGWRSTASKNIENSRLCTKISKDVFGMKGPLYNSFKNWGPRFLKSPPLVSLPWPWIFHEWIHPRRLVYP